MELRLCIGSKGGVRMFATVDTSYATHDDLKSHSMWTLYLGTGGSLISRTKKHSITTDSSTYAELVGAHLSLRDIQWARNFLKEVGYTHLEPTVLYIDNQSTLKIIAKQHQNMLIFDINSLLKRSIMVRLSVSICPHTS